MSARPLEPVIGAVKSARPNDSNLRHSVRPRTGRDRQQPLRCRTAVADDRQGRAHTRQPLRKSRVSKADARALLLLDLERLAATFARSVDQIRAVQHALSFAAVHCGFATSDSM